MHSHKCCMHAYRGAGGGLHSLRPVVQPPLISNWYMELARPIVICAVRIQGQMAVSLMYAYAKIITWSYLLSALTSGPLTHSLAHSLTHWH
eukprot:1160002-Pelagomonas_calceolata.AAC.12